MAVEEAQQLPAAAVQAQAAPAAAGPERACDQCFRRFDSVAKGRVSGKQTWTCRHCLTLQTMLYRNLGTEKEIGWGPQARAAFFKQAAELDTGNSRYTWETVRSVLIEVKTKRHMEERSTKVFSEALPKSVWLQRGYLAEDVEKHPSEQDEKFGVLYSLPVKSHTWADTHQWITEEILQKERKAKAKKGGKQQPEDGECWDLPKETAGTSSQPAGKGKRQQAKEEGNPDKKQKTEKALAAERQKQDKRNEATCVLAAKAVGQLAGIVKACQSVCGQGQKHGIQAEKLEALTKAEEHLGQWKKTCTDFITAAAAAKGCGAKLPELPFGREDLKDRLKASNALLREVRAIIAEAKEAKAHEAATAAEAEAAGRDPGQ